MKKSILLCLSIISKFTCFGQSLFFNKLDNSIWKSESIYNDATIRVSNKIGLRKITHTLDSLKVNATIWNFKDGLLIIKHYNCNRKTDSLIAKYHYQANADKGIFRIMFDDKMYFDYGVGIISSGNYVQLTRRNGKMNK